MNDFVAMTKCFYCGEGHSILLHERLEDISKLHNAVTTLEPCSKCKEKFKEYVLLVLSKDGTADSIDGRYIAMKKETFKQAFNKEVPNDICFIDEELFSMIEKGIKK